MSGNSNHTSYDPLDPDDRILWDAVRSTVASIHAQKETMLELESSNFAKAMAAVFVAPTSLAPQGQVKKHVTHIPPIHPFDRPTHRKISKGRIHIDARVDLHGLIQDEAHALLLHFLQKAQQRGLRHVLVITGKGSSNGSEGVLRQRVPYWLSTPPFRHFVSAFEDSARHHGGHGALYIRLRRLSMET